LNFDSNGQGGDIVVFTGEARLSPDEPPADEHPEYLAKYREAMTRLFGSPAGFVERYPHAMRVVPDRVRG
jgi:PPOX class probable F420-dependent enzyme